VLWPAPARSSGVPRAKENSSRGAFFTPGNGDAGAGDRPLAKGWWSQALPGRDVLKPRKRSSVTVSGTTIAESLEFSIFSRGKPGQNAVGVRLSECGAGKATDGH
jgi:hypothetical protein